MPFWVAMPGQIVSAQLLVTSNGMGVRLLWSSSVTWADDDVMDALPVVSVLLIAVGPGPERFAGPP